MAAGVTEKVLQQKAQGRTFFSKMLYLAESDLLEGSDALPAEDVHAVRFLGHRIAASSMHVGTLKCAYALLFLVRGSCPFVCFPC